MAQSQFPGDEHGFYVASSIPAAWMAPFLLLGRVSKEAIPICVLLASNLGLYLSVVLSVIVTGITRGVRWLTAVWKEARREIGGPRTPLQD